MDDRIQRRFDELAEMAERIASSKQMRPGKRVSSVQSLGGPVVYDAVTIADIDKNLCLQWSTSVLTLVEGVFGESSPVYKRFEQSTRLKNIDDHQYFDTLNSVFRSAKDDFEGDYLFDVRNLVHADVFSDEPEQAKHFLDKSSCLSVNQFELKKSGSNCERSPRR